jgi:predicted molibdopterin-dependent oxidoreductase YjgC
VTVSLQVSLRVDGRLVEVPVGSTLLDACNAASVDTPTLCWARNLTPQNACRICVVELAGARALSPACSRIAEAGMEIATDSARVRHSRKLVLEFLASTVDISTAPALQEYCQRYGAEPARFAGGQTLTERPVKIDNDAYIRDYAKCITCYKCVQACGTEAQNTFAIAVGGRGFGAHITAEWDVDLPESACVYCGNCVAVCPTGALMPKTEWDLRAAGRWDETSQTTTDTICSYCGVGCQLTLHVQDNRIVKVTSPADNDITLGNLCVKGRFGWTYVHSGMDEPPPVPPVIP